MRKRRQWASTSARKIRNFKSAATCAATAWRSRPIRRRAIRRVQGGGAKEDRNLGSPSRTTTFRCCRRRLAPPPQAIRSHVWSRNRATPQPERPLSRRLVQLYDARPARRRSVLGERGASEAPARGAARGGAARDGGAAAVLPGPPLPQRPRMCCRPASCSCSASPAPPPRTAPFAGSRFGASSNFFLQAGSTSTAEPTQDRCLQLLKETETGCRLHGWAADAGDAYSGCSSSGCGSSRATPKIQCLKSCFSSFCTCYVWAMRATLMVWGMVGRLAG